MDLGENQELGYRGALRALLAVLIERDVGLMVDEVIRDEGLSRKKVVERSRLRGEYTQLRLKDRPGRELLAVFLQNWKEKANKVIETERGG